MGTNSSLCLLNEQGKRLRAKMVYGKVRELPFVSSNGMFQNLPYVDTTYSNF